MFTMDQNQEPLSPDALAQLEQMKNKIVADLHARARMSINAAIVDVLTEGDLVILGMIGVDGRREMLNAFIEECNSLMGEL
jgi:hypothetical protein